MKNKNSQFSMLNYPGNGNYSLPAVWTDCLNFIQAIDPGRPDAIKEMLGFVYDILPIQAIVYSHFDSKSEKIIRSEGWGCPVGFRHNEPVEKTVCYHKFVAEKLPIAICRDLQSCDDGKSDPDTQETNFKAYLGFPVKLDGTIFGFLEVFDRIPREFDAFEIFFVSSVAFLISFRCFHLKFSFITEQERHYGEFEAHRTEMEALLKERADELVRKNEQLTEEIKRRCEATEKLQANTESLKELRTAIRILSDRHTEDHHRAEQVVRMSLKELIDPYIERLESSGLNTSQRQLLDVIRMNMEEVMGSAMPELSGKYHMLSPNEIQVVNLVRKGKTTKEISRLMNLSVRTIEAYRNRVRKKLNIKNKKINLRTYLLSV